MDADTLQKLTVLYQLIESLRAKDNWCGETHVQKAGFFLEQLSDNVLGYEYVLYKHGPFSFGVSEDLASMKSLRFIDEVIAHPNYGPRLKNNPEAGKMLKESFGGRCRQLAGALDFVVSKLCGYGVVTLERVATALYFTKQERVEDLNERAQRIHRIKPHISLVSALDAISNVENILTEWQQVKVDLPASLA